MARTHFAREFTSHQAVSGTARRLGSDISQTGRRRQPGVRHGAALGLLFATLSFAQPSYTFTSGF